MVTLNIIKNSNLQLKVAGIPKIAVFVGATSGIGHSTLTELVEAGTRTKIYLIGRPSAAARIKDRISQFAASNPLAEIIWLEGEISLLSDVQRICREIQSKESTLDLLFLSSGFLPFSGRKETSEGLDASQALQYFSRIAFITNLLPLLRSSSTGRVVSVLGGGLERTTIDAEDLELRKPGAFGAVRSQTHLVAMNTLMMEKLAEQEKTVTFIHAFPGQVNTGNLAADLSPYSPTAWLLRIVVQPLITVIGLSQKESGQRHLFASTSSLYGGKGVPTDLPAAKNTKGEAGPGLFLVNQYGEASLNTEALNELRKDAQGKVWQLTESILERYCS